MTLFFSLIVVLYIESIDFLLHIDSVFTPLLHDESKSLLPNLLLVVSTSPPPPPDLHRIHRCSLPTKKKVAMRTVIKFGGSSLATAERLREVATLVKLLISEGQTPTMVCSAMGKTTNNLLNAGDFALRDGKVCDPWGVGQCFFIYLLLLTLLLIHLFCSPL